MGKSTSTTSSGSAAVEDRGNTHSGASVSTKSVGGGVSTSTAKSTSTSTTKSTGTTGGQSKATSVFTNNVNSTSSKSTPQYQYGSLNTKIYTANSNTTPITAANVNVYNPKKDTTKTTTTQKTSTPNLTTPIKIKSKDGLVYNTEAEENDSPTLIRFTNGRTYDTETKQVGGSFDLSGKQSGQNYNQRNRLYVTAVGGKTEVDSETGERNIVGDWSTTKKTTEDGKQVDNYTYKEADGNKITKITNAGGDVEYSSVDDMQTATSNILDVANRWLKSTVTPEGYQVTKDVANLSADGTYKSGSTSTMAGVNAENKEELVEAISTLRDNLSGMLERQEKDFTLEERQTIQNSIDELDTAYSAVVHEIPIITSWDDLGYAEEVLNVQKDAYVDATNNILYYNDGTNTDELTESAKQSLVKMESTVFAMNDYAEKNKEGLSQLVVDEDGTTAYDYLKSYIGSELLVLYDAEQDISSVTDIAEVSPVTQGNLDQANALVEEKAQELSRAKALRKAAKLEGYQHDADLTKGLLYDGYVEAEAKAQAAYDDAVSDRDNQKIALSYRFVGNYGMSYDEALAQLETQKSLYSETEYNARKNYLESGKKSEVQNELAGTFSDFNEEELNSAISLFTDADDGDSNHDLRRRAILNLLGLEYEYSTEEGEGKDLSYMTELYNNVGETEKVLKERTTKLQEYESRLAGGSLLTSNFTEEEIDEYEALKHGDTSVKAAKKAYRKAVNDYESEYGTYMTEQEALLTEDDLADIEAKGLSVEDYLTENFKSGVVLHQEETVSNADEINQQVLEVLYRAKSALAYKDRENTLVDIKGSSNGTALRDLSKEYDETTLADAEAEAQAEEDKLTEHYREYLIQNGTSDAMTKAEFAASTVDPEDPNGRTFDQVLTEKRLVVNDATSVSDYYKSHQYDDIDKTRNYSALVTEGANLSLDWQSDVDELKDAIDFVNTANSTLEITEQNLYKPIIEKIWEMGWADDGDVETAQKIIDYMGVHTIDFMNKPTNMSGRVVSAVYDPSTGKLNTDKTIYADDVFNYLVATEGYYSALNYIGDLNNEDRLTSKQTALQEAIRLAQYKDKIDPTSIDSFLATPWITSPLSAVGSAIDVVQQTVQKAQSGKIEVSDKQTLAEACDQVTQEYSAILSGRPETIFGKDLSFYYNAYSSFVNSTESMLIGQGIGTALGLSGTALTTFTKQFTDATFFATSMNQKLQEEIQNGTDSKTALEVSAATGFFECFFEKFSLGNLVDSFMGTGITSAKQWMKQVATSIGVEISEEVFTAVADRWVDSNMKGYDSERQTAITQYMAQGYTAAQAAELFEKDFEAELKDTAISTMLSTGASQFVATVKNIPQISAIGSSINGVERNGRNGGSELIDSLIADETYRNMVFKGLTKEEAEAEQSGRKTTENTSFFKSIGDKILDTVYAKFDEVVGGDTNATELEALDTIDKIVKEVTETGGTPTDIQTGALWSAVNQLGKDYTNRIIASNKNLFSQVDVTMAQQALIGNTLEYENMGDLIERYSLYKANPESFVVSDMTNELYESSSAKSKADAWYNAVNGAELIDALVFGRTQFEERSKDEKSVTRVSLTEQNIDTWIDTLFPTEAEKAVVVKYLVGQQKLQAETIQAYQETMQGPDYNSSGRFSMNPQTIKGINFGDTNVSGDQDLSLLLKTAWYNAQLEDYAAVAYQREKLLAAERAIVNRMSAKERRKYALDKVMGRTGNIKDSVKNEIARKKAKEMAQSSERIPWDAKYRNDNDWVQLGENTPKITRAEYVRHWMSSVKTQNEALVKGNVEAANRNFDCLICTATDTSYAKMLGYSAGMVNWNLEKNEPTEQAKAEANKEARAEAKAEETAAEEATTEEATEEETEEVAEEETEEEVAEEVTEEEAEEVAEEVVEETKPKTKPVIPVNKVAEETKIAEAYYNSKISPKGNKALTATQVKSSAANFIKNTIPTIIKTQAGYYSTGFSSGLSSEQIAKDFSAYAHTVNDILKIRGYTIDGITYDDGESTKQLPAYTFTVVKADEKTAKEDLDAKIKAAEAKSNGESAQTQQAETPKAKPKAKSGARELTAKEVVLRAKQGEIDLGNGYAVHWEDNNKKCVLTKDGKQTLYSTAGGLGGYATVVDYIEKNNLYTNKITVEDTSKPKAEDKAKAKAEEEQRKAEAKKLQEEQKVAEKKAQQKAKEEARAKAEEQKKAAEQELQETTQKHDEAIAKRDEAQKTLDKVKAESTTTEKTKAVGDKERHKKAVNAYVAATEALTQAEQKVKDTEFALKDAEAKIEAANKAISEADTTTLAQTPQKSYSYDVVEELSDDEVALRIAQWNEEAQAIAAKRVSQEEADTPKLSADELMLVDVEQEIRNSIKELNVARNETLPELKQRIIEAHKAGKFDLAKKLQSEDLPEAYANILRIENRIENYKKAQISEVRTEHLTSILDSLQADKERKEKEMEVAQATYLAMLEQGDRAEADRYGAKVDALYQEWRAILRDIFDISYDLNEETTYNVQQTSTEDITERNRDVVTKGDRYRSGGTKRTRRKTTPARVGLYSAFKDVLRFLGANQGVIDSRLVRFDSLTASEKTYRRLNAKERRLVDEASKSGVKRVVICRSKSDLILDGNKAGGVFQKFGFERTLEDGTTIYTIGSMAIIEEYRGTKAAGQSRTEIIKAQAKENGTTPVFSREFGKTVDEGIDYEIEAYHEFGHSAISSVQDPRARLSYMTKGIQDAFGADPNAVYVYQLLINNYVSRYGKVYDGKLDKSALILEELFNDIRVGYDRYGIISMAEELAGADYAKLMEEILIKAKNRLNIFYDATDIQAFAREYWDTNKELDIEFGPLSFIRGELPYSEVIDYSVLKDEVVADLDSDSGKMSLESLFYNSGFHVQYQITDGDTTYNTTYAQFIENSYAENPNLSVDEIKAKFLDLHPSAIGLVKFNKDGSVTAVKEVTAEQMKDTPMGNMVTLSNRNGFITEDDMKNQYQFLADVANMVVEYQDSEMVWKIVGSQLFSAVKSNSDPQYNKTVDFSTICKKTQAIIDAIGAIEKELHRGLTKDEVKLVYLIVGENKETTPCPVCYVFSRWMGLGSVMSNMSKFQNSFGEGHDEDLLKLLNEVDGYIKEDLSSLENNDKDANNPSISKALGRIQNRALKKLKTAVDLVVYADDRQKELDTLRASGKTSKTARDRMAWLESKLANIDQAQKDLEDADRLYEACDAYKWALKVRVYRQGQEVPVEDDAETDVGQVEETPAEEELDKDVKDAREKWERKLRKSLETLNSEWKFFHDEGNVPDNILFDRNAGDSFSSQYPRAWSYRTSRGAGMGKAILPYADMYVGDVIQAISKSDVNKISKLDDSPFLNGAFGRFLDEQQNGKDLSKESKALATTIKNAIEKQKQQNLIGGLRYQSTSDFRYDYGSDYLMSFLECQAIGANVQLYTKVIEAVDFLATVGCDVNISLMPKGKGYDANNNLLFSDVSGVNYDAAQKMVNKYDNVQCIMVGINKQHIKLCLESDEITFVIPYHASGNSKATLQELMATFGENIDFLSIKDFSKYQEEHNGTINKSTRKIDSKTPEQKELFEFREAIIKGDLGKVIVDKKTGAKTLQLNELTSNQLAMLNNYEMLRDLYRRFYLDAVADNGLLLPVSEETRNHPVYKMYTEEENKKFKSKYYLGNVNECYGTFLSKADKIFPYEYWDKSSTLETADVNGEAFKSYCAMFGLVPRFSGYNSDGVYNADYDLSGLKGYWKTLIDRKMYNNDGTYRAQKRINISNLVVEDIAEEDLGKPKEGATYNIATLKTQHGSREFGEAMSKENDPSKTAKIKDDFFYAKGKLKGKMQAGEISKQAIKDGDYMTAAKTTLENSDEQPLKFTSYLAENKGVVLDQTEKKPPKPRKTKAEKEAEKEAEKAAILQEFTEKHPVDAKFSADVDADENALPLAKSLIYFAGGGTLENGLQGLLDTQVAVEMQPGLAAIYKLNHGDKVYLGKVQDFEKTELDALKGLIEYFHASPVCCNYSPLNNGNKYATKEDSPLDKETAQATANTIEKLLPKVFTLENVPGYEKSEAVQIVLNALEKNGYHPKSAVFDASDYGAPTTRRRWLLWAVRDEKNIPDAPVATTPTNKTAWNSVVDFDSLEDGELQNFMRARLEKPEIMAKFDYRHPGQKILILYGTPGKAGEHTVAWYPEGVPCGTLRTKNDGRIIMEDGTVKLIDPETYKQLQGLSTYVLPPNGSRQKTNSYKVVGNGIPPQLTRAVFGPIIEEYIIKDKRVDELIASDSKYSLDETLARDWDIEENPFTMSMDELNGLSTYFNNQLKANDKYLAEIRQSMPKPPSDNDPAWYEEYHKWAVESGYNEVQTDISHISYIIAGLDALKKWRELDDVDLMTIAEEHFGTTEDPTAAGFILPNGKMLHTAEVPRRYSGKFHEDIKTVFPVTGMPASEYVQWFIAKGAIRIDTASDGIEIPGIGKLSQAEPTDAQYDTLREYLNYMDTLGMLDRFFVETQAALDKPHFFDTYYASSVSKIINDIKAYYDSERTDNVISYSENSDTVDATELDSNTKYSVDESYIPEHIQWGFKLMTVDENGNPHPMFIDKEKALPLNTWLMAESPNLSYLHGLEPEYAYLVDVKTNEVDVEHKRPVKKNKSGFSGLPNVSMIEDATRNGKRWMIVSHYANGAEAVYNVGISGSKNPGPSTFAIRPGYHATDMPSMKHIGPEYTDENGESQKYRSPSQRWFLVEYPIDVDYNAEAYGNDRKDIPDHLPVNGWYSFQTNSGAEKSQHWFITGAIKIIGAVTEEDARKFIDKYGHAKGELKTSYDLNWVKGKSYDDTQNHIDLMAYAENHQDTKTPGRREMKHRIEKSLAEKGIPIETAKYSLDELPNNYDSLSTDQQKWVKDNLANDDVGTRLFNLNHNDIARTESLNIIGADGKKTNIVPKVGKTIGGYTYAHISYIDRIVPAEEIKAAYAAMEKAFPAAKFNCFNYKPSQKHELVFQEGAHFDTEREPVVGQNYKITFNDDGTATATLGIYSKQIWHHKWLWVDDKYKGFDIEEAWNWSKQYLNTITGKVHYNNANGRPASINETKPNVSPNGSSVENWNCQLRAYGLPEMAMSWAYEDQTKKLSAKELEAIRNSYREDIGFRLPLNSGFYYTYNPAYTDVYGNKLYVKSTSSQWSPSTYIDENGERRILTTNTYKTAVRRKVGDEEVVGCPLFEKFSAKEVEMLEKENQVIQRNSRTGTSDNTQNPSTIPTYEGVFKHLDTELTPEAKKKFRVLDASSGKGLGTAEGRKKGFNVTDLEPFPEPGYKPMYERYKDLQFDIANGKQEPYDFIISNAVINVCTQDERDEVVAALGTFLKEGGRIFLNTMPAGYKISETNKKGEANGSIVTVPRTKEHGIEGFVLGSASVQKGYNAEELRQYLLDVLTQTNGGEWLVETVPSDWKVSGGTKVIITKKKDSGVISRFADPAKYSLDDIEYELEQSVIESLTPNSPAQLYSLDDMGAARWTEETLDKHIQIHKYGRSKSDSWLTWMTPEEYLSLTIGKEEWGKRIRDEVDEFYGDLNTEKLTLNEQQGVGIELFVDTSAPGLKPVVGHEGRHRSILLEKVGVTKMPVRIIDRETRYDDNKQPYESMRLKAQNFYGDTTGAIVHLGELIPITEEYREQLMDEFVRGGDENTIRYSLDEDSLGAPLTEDQIKFFADSKVRDEDGKLIPVFHGTMSDFWIFDRNFSNPESNAGAGYYFTDNYQDVKSNYGTTGADMEQKIEILADQIYDAVQYDGFDEYDGTPVNSYEDAKRLATQKLAPRGLDNPRFIDAYLNIVNPAVIGGENPTYLTYIEHYNDYTDEYEEPTGTLIDFLWAMNEVMMDYSEWNDYAHKTNAFDAWNNGEFIGENDVTIDQIYQVFDEALLDWVDEDGKLISREMVRDALERAGFDGIIDHTVSSKFGNTSGRANPMKGVNEGTTHYIAFHSNQIKLQTNEHPTLNNDIRYSLDEINYEHPDVHIGLNFSDPTGVLLERIFDRTKTYETREWNDNRGNGKIPGAYLNKTIGIVRTSDATGKARLVGYWKLGEPELIDFSTWDFKHLKDWQKDILNGVALDGTEYAVTPSSKKWIYPIEYVEELKTPREINRAVQRASKLEAKPEQIDEAYLKALDNDDLELADSIIKDLAKKLGYDIEAYHGTANDFTVFDKERIGENYNGWAKLGAGFYFSPSEKEAKLWAEKARNGYKSKVMHVFLKSNKMFNAFAPLTDEDVKNSILSTKHPDLVNEVRKDGYRFLDYLKKDLDYSAGEIRDELMAMGYDGVGELYESGRAGEYVVFEPEQIKSADTVTYDDNHKPIVPSERFNLVDPDIRYSIDPADLVAKWIDPPEYTLDSFIQRTIQLGGDVEAAEKLLNDVFEKSKKDVKTTTAPPKTSDGKAVIPPNTVRTTPQINRNKAAWERYIKNFGEIKHGERPEHRDPIPARRSVTKKTSKAFRTIYEAFDYVPFNDAQINAFVVDNAGAYKPITNAEDRNYAEQKYDSLGDKAFDKLYHEWTSKYDSGTRITSKDIAIAAKLMQEARTLDKLHPNSGYLDAMLRIACDLDVLAPEYGQVIQAFRLIKSTTPAGALYYANRVVERLNKQYEDRISRGKMNTIVIDEDIAELIATASTQEEFDNAMELFKQSIARQIPATWMDWWNAWRYLAMLGNPKTHLRNFLGNIGFTPLVMVKNAIATVGEDTAEKLGKLPKNLRTKSWGIYSHRDALTRQVCEEAYNKVEDAITTNGRVDIYNEILESRNIWEKIPGTDVELPHFGKVMKWLEKTNAEGFIKASPVFGLEAGDAFFIRKYFLSSMAYFLDARGVDFNNLDTEDEEQMLWVDETVNEAVRYATQEALKATYHDASTFATALNRLKKTPFLGVFVEGVLPFTKTPANIFKRGVMEYSPIGLIRGVVQMARANTPERLAEGIDMMASGMTGTMIAILGFFLSRLGLIRGGGSDDDKEANEESLIGMQDYAVIVNNGKATYTIGWLAPLSLPLFLGCQINEALAREDSEGWEVIQAACKVAEPILSLSMLDGVNDLFTTISNAEDNEKLFAVLFSMSSSYFTQSIPTLLAQTAKTLDTTQRRSYVDKNSNAPSYIQKFWQNSVLAKIPGLEETRIPYVDSWGRMEVEENAAVRFFDNFFSPGYRAIVEDTDVDQELRRLASSLGNTSILPGNAAHSFSIDGETLQLDGEQYVELQQTRGQTAYALLADIINSSEYQSKTDAEKYKIVDNVYSYAGAVAKNTVAPEYEMDNWVNLANKVGAADYIIMKAGLSEDTTNKNLFTTALSNPELDTKQQAILIASAFSPPIYVDSIASDGYRYKLTEADDTRLAEIREEKFIDAYMEMTSDEDWNSLTLDEKNEKVDTLYNEVLNESKTLLAEELDADGREKEPGNATGVDHTLKKPKANEIAITEYSSAKDRAEYLAGIYDTPNYLTVDAENDPSMVYYLDASQKKELDKMYLEALETNLSDIESDLASYDYNQRMIAVETAQDKAAEYAEGTYLAEMKLGLHGETTEALGEPDKIAYTYVGSAMNQVRQNDMLTLDEQIDWLCEKFGFTNETSKEGKWPSDTKMAHYNYYKEILTNGGYGLPSYDEYMNSIASLSEDQQDYNFNKYYHTKVRDKAKELALKEYPITK